MATHNHSQHHSLLESELGLTIYNETLEEDIAKSSSRTLWHYVFVSIALVGIVANAGLIWRRKKTSKRASSTTKTSLFLLSVMAAADTICLFSLLFMLTQRYFYIKDPLFLNLVCKLDLFLIHMTSAFSIWCWLVLSAVRYVAVYRPYMHLQLDKEPKLAVIVLAVFCFLLESWVLYDIQYDPTTQACISVSPEWLSKNLQIAEIVISYFLPVAILTVLDMKVLLCRAMFLHNGKSRKKQQNATKSLMTQASIDEKPQETTGVMSLNKALLDTGKLIGGTTKMETFEESSIGLKRARSKKRQQQIKVLRRCLCITILDLSMNLPSYLLRLYLTVVSPEEFSELNMDYIEMIETISQVLYFAQFALNALYLVCIIYDTPQKRREKQLLSSQLTSAYYSFSARSSSMKSVKSNKRSFRVNDGNILMV